MAKIVVAFRDRTAAESVSSLLRESGYEVLRICTSGNEVKRAFGLIQDGILISGWRLKDRNLDQVLEDLGEHVEVLCISKTEQFASVRKANVFHISPPVRKSVLAAWADMLIQLHYQKLPHRDEVGREVISEAKRKVMQELKISEQEAHRYLQNLSMRLGIRMEQVAERVLSHGTE
ncbi:MAG: ANTAR domain-containing protein [Solobacterium sp.]|nr:ANTAR domain-containing protein [Solobacterium sp.]